MMIVVPLRLGVTWVQLKWVLTTNAVEHKNVAVALLPNLIFGIVLAQILREKFQLDADLYLALIVYTVGISIFPAFILKSTSSILSPYNYDDLLTAPESDEAGEKSNPQS